MTDPAQSVPYFCRLFVDLDPSGGPIGAGVIHFRLGQEEGTLLYFVPGPFDSPTGVFADLRTLYETVIGEQLTLF